MDFALDTQGRFFYTLRIKKRLLITSLHCIAEELTGHWNSLQSGPQSFAGYEHTVGDHLIPGVGSGGRPNLALELAKSNTRLMRLEADRARAYFEHTKADNTGALQSAFSGLAEAAEDAVEAMRLGRNSRELAEALRQVREKGGIG